MIHKQSEQRRSFLQMPKRSTPTRTGMEERRIARMECGRIMHLRYEEVAVLDGLAQVWKTTRRDALQRVIENASRDLLNAATIAAE